MRESWMAVRTRCRQERTAREWIQESGFETFLPLATDHVSQKDYPLFPGYLFVYVVDRWRCLLGMRGVVDVVRVGSAPGRVRTEDIQRLQRMGTVCLSTARFKHGDRVRVGSSHWAAGQCGAFEYMHGRDRARVLLALLGRMVPVEVEEATLELA